MSSPWDAIEGTDENTTEALINYSGVEYTQEEAEKLVGWLSLPEFALLARMFEAVRNESVAMMDSGAITVANSEELVRHSAMRLLIAQVMDMQAIMEAELAERQESK